MELIFTCQHLSLDSTTEQMVSGMCTQNMAPSRQNKLLTLQVTVSILFFFPQLLKLYAVHICYPTSIFLSRYCLVILISSLISGFCMFQKTIHTMYLPHSRILVELPPPPTTQFFVIIYFLSYCLKIFQDSLGVSWEEGGGRGGEEGGQGQVHLYPWIFLKITHHCAKLLLVRHSHASLISLFVIIVILCLI